VLKAQEPTLTHGQLRAWARKLDGFQTVRPGPASPPPAQALAPPPPAGFIPISPNESRALNSAQKMAEDPSRPRGGIVISGPNRTIVIQPGQRLLPAAQPIVRAQAPTTEPNRKPMVHTPWTTPSMKALAELVHER